MISHPHAWVQVILTPQYDGGHLLSLTAYREFPL